jgi:hypothetical protein
MKKTLTLLVLLLITTIGFAQSFVMITTDNQQETENLFNNKNLKIHYYNDNFVLATAKTVNESMMVLDTEAFSDNDVYTIVYCPQAEQQSYLGDGKALIQTANFMVVKGIAVPYKNDGAVAVFNKEAKMTAAHRDFPVITEENPLIREMMNQVSMDSLEATVQHLQDYQNRMWNSQNAFDASDWIAGRMTALGLEVEQQPFYASTWTGSGQAAPNVIGIQRGTLYPDVYVVCGSHFDSFSYEAMYGGGTCPGADDNATGVASVLESARIMTQYEFEYSIIYCAYGCEEMGLYGSEAYASRCQQEGMEILGYFNNDMNGYLYGDQIHIDCIYPNSVAPIGDYYMNVGSVYFPELPIRHVNFNEGDSDHTSFNNHGYMGIYPFEDYQHYSPNIHTTNDLIGPSVNSFEMSQQYCRMNIGCLAELANPAGEPQIHCNPVENIAIEYPYNDDYTFLKLSWDMPSSGSTGTLSYYKVFRDDVLVDTLTSFDYLYFDTITDGVTAQYYVTAVYSDDCEAVSETVVVQGTLDIPEIDALDGDVVRYEVYDLMGRKVDRHELDELKAGIYIVKYYKKSGSVFTKKIVKR